MKILQKLLPKSTTSSLFKRTIRKRQQPSNLIFASISNPSDVESQFPKFDLTEPFANYSYTRNWAYRKVWQQSIPISRHVKLISSKIPHKRTQSLWKIEKNKNMLISGKDSSRATGNMSLDDHEESSNFCIESTTANHSNIRAIRSHNAKYEEKIAAKRKIADHIIIRCWKSPI